MDFEGLKGLIGIIVFIAVIGYNVIMPVIKGLKESREIEASHEKRERPKPQRGRPQPNPAQARPAASATRMAGQDRSRKYEDYSESDAPSAPASWDIQPEDFMQVQPPQTRPLSQKSRQKKRKAKPQESAQELLARLTRESEAKLESGEICDACYDTHSEETKYGEILKRHDSLVSAFVVSELLGKPLSLRGDGGVFDSKF